MSQEHLELFFCALRKSGGWCPNPTCAQFVSAYKRLLVHHQITPSNGNVEAQDGTTILHVAAKSKNQLDPYDSSVYEEALNIRVQKKYGLDALEADIPSNEDFSLENFLLFRNILPADISNFGKFSVTYIAGWVVRKLSEGKKPQIACEPCRHAMVDRADSTNLEDYALVISNHRGGLIFPSQSVLKICFHRNFIEISSGNS